MDTLRIGGMHPISGGAPDDSPLDEKEQRMVNLLLGNMRKETERLLKPLTDEVSGLKRDVGATHEKFSSVLKTIDDNLADLDESDDDEEEADPRLVARYEKMSDSALIAEAQRLLAEEAADGSGGDSEDDEEDEPLPSRSGGVANDDRRVDFERRRQERRIRRLEDQLRERDVLAKENEVRRIDSERDRLLGAAVSDARPVDSRAAMRLLSDRVRWDGDAGHHVYTTSEGAAFPMSDDGFEEFKRAVADDMPDFLRPSATSNGGAGSNSTKLASMLEGMRHEVVALEKRAQDSRLDADIARYHAKKREVEKLEHESSGRAAAGTRR